MTKRVYRYFLDFTGKQQDWLNEMAMQGWRLTKCAILTYEFESCKPGEFEYRIDLTNQRTFADVKDYKAFVEGLGYKTFYKNININWSVGKVRIRPRGVFGSWVATSPGRLNKELLIVEKPNDGKPFELHTDNADVARFYGSLHKAYLYGGAIWVVFALVMMIVQTVVNGSRGLLLTAPLMMALLLLIVPNFVLAAKYGNLTKQFKELGRTNE